MAQWALQDAKNRFSAIVDAALRGEPQTVTRRGAPAVVVVSVQDYQRLRRAETVKAPTFVEHLLAIPKDGPDEVFGRPAASLRDVEW